MSANVSNARKSEEINSIDSVRPRMAKAVNGSQLELRRLIAESIRVVTSQKAAAADMEIDPAQLTRQLQTGHITVERLEALDAAWAIEFARQLLETYGPLATPKTRARQKLREARAIVEELDQLLEHIA